MWSALFPGSRLILLVAKGVLYMVSLRQLEVWAVYPPIVPPDQLPILHSPSCSVIALGG